MNHVDPNAEVTNESRFADPASASGHPTGSVLLVSARVDRWICEGGVARQVNLLASILGRAGWNVVLLNAGEPCGPNEKRTLAHRLSEAKVHYVELAEFPEPPGLDLPTFPTNESKVLRRADHVRAAAELLHQRHQFDLIEFVDYQAVGFRAVQAKRLGLAFQDVDLISSLHRPSQWAREANGDWPSGLSDLMLDFAERYAFDHADIQTASTMYLMDYAIQNGWNVRRDAKLIPLAFPPSAPVRSEAVSAGPVELVFFGRATSRKGIELFVETAKKLPPEQPVALLLRPDRLVTGIAGVDYARYRLRKRPFTLIDHFNSEQALHYLRHGHRVAVLPSTAETVPHGLIECATRGIPFVASNVGAIPELLSDEELQQIVLFKATFRDLPKHLERYLSLDVSVRQWAVERAASLFDSGVNREEILRAYGELLSRVNRRPERSLEWAETRGSTALAESSVVGRSARFSPSRAVGTSDRGRISTPLGRGEGAIDRGSSHDETGPTNVLSSISQGDPDVDDVPLVTVAVPYFNCEEFLPDTLASLAQQTYPRLEVIVIDDGSTSAEARAVFDQSRLDYPQFRFISQENQGIGATRNRGLREAKGEYFIPVDADNVCPPYMVETFVNAMRSAPDVSCMTCYARAFRKTPDIAKGRFIFAYRPLSGPHVVGSTINVYGDANAIFKTRDLRAMGGYETDRETSFEDWECFCKLVNHGYKIDVVPEYLLWYRYREGSFTKVTSLYQNHRRVLRQYLGDLKLTRAEAIALWTGFEGLHWHAEERAFEIKRLRHHLKQVRYRIADGLNDAIKKVPLAHRGVKSVVKIGEWLVDVALLPFGKGNKARDFWWSEYGKEYRRLQDVLAEESRRLRERDD